MRSAIRRAPGSAAGWAALVAAVVAAGAIPLPGLVSGPVLGDVTGAVALAGPAAGAALAAATGRPPLAMAALAGTGAYVGGIAAVHGWDVPLAVAMGAASAAAAGAVLGLLAARLEPMAFLALSFVAAALGGALVLASPRVTGAESGLGPLPGLRIPLGGGSVAVLGRDGSFHAVLGVALVSTLVAAVLVGVGPGARWRAVGGDPERAAATGLAPLRAQVEALAAGGALAGVCGAVAAEAAGLATPASFGPDAAVLPLAAALLAGRAGPAAAALLAVAAAVIGRAVLPAAGYTGPPSAEALATGFLAAGVVVTLLLPRPRRRRATAEIEAPVPSPDGPWPEMSPRGGPAGLQVEDLDVRAGPGGPPLVAGLRLQVGAGEVHGLVGANGSGKTTVLRGIAGALRRGRIARLDPGDGGRSIAMLPQGGGGFPGCTVAETLRLAGRHAGAGPAEVAAWLDRLGLTRLAGRRCEELPAGARRRLDLGRALLGRPALLLCDEPLAGLDPDERALAIACLGAAAAAGVAILLAEHDRPSLATLATSATELRRDRLDAVSVAVT